MSGYIYAIQVREFLKTQENVIKIGRTVDIVQRFCQYPKGSRLLYTCWVSDCTASENVLVKSMCSTFVHRKDLGKEYFEGSITSMIKHIQETVSLPTCYFDGMVVVNMTQTNTQPMIIDINTSIKVFVDENIAKYRGVIYKSVSMYGEYIVWLTSNKHRVAVPSISHKRFSMGLASQYNVTMKPYRFADGLAASIKINGTDTTLINGTNHVTECFVEDVIIPTLDKKDILMMRDVYGAYQGYCRLTGATPIKSKYLKEELICFLGDITFKSCGLSNFWRGYKLKKEIDVVQPTIVCNDTEKHNSLMDCREKEEMDFLDLE